MKSTLTLALLYLLAGNARAEGRSWQLEIPGAIAIEALPPGMGVTPLLHVSTDRGSEEYDLGLLRDAALNPQGFYMGDVHTGKPFLLREIAKPDGVTLFETQGRKVLILQGTYDRKKRQGNFELRYLTNGIFNTYKSCDVNLRSQGQEFWLQNAYTNQRVSEARLVTTTFGVSTIEGICPARHR